MKVISLLQPWATLVVIGAKKIETRSWNTKYRGPLLIHASANKSLKLANIHYGFCEKFSGLEYQPWLQLPFGAIIGKVDLVSTTTAENVLAMAAAGIPIQDGLPLTAWNWEKAFGDYSPNRYGWLLKDPELFKNPIPAKGKLGLWEYDYSLDKGR